MTIHDPPPPVIRVLGVDLIVREGTSEEMTEFDGLMYGSQGLIIYDPTQSSDNLRDTIIHELIHFVEFKLGFKLQHELVQVLSAVFSAILSDNEELTKWFMNSDLHWIE